MKKTTLLTAFLLLLAWGSHSQCTRNYQNPWGTNVVSNNLGLPQQISSSMVTDSYTQLSNLVVGLDYLFTCTLNSDGSDKYITVTDWNNNVIAHGESPLTVESITHSQIRLHYSDNATCGQTYEDHTVTITVLINCLPPVSLLVSGITTTNATFTWEPQGEETAWEVLVLEADLPTPTGSTNGAPIMDTPEFTTTILETASGYTFYVRANCGSEFSPWNKLNFISGCDPVNVFYENFETTGYGELPTCWSAIVSGEGISEYAYIEGREYNGVGNSHSVELYRSDSGPDADVILVSPALASLSLGTHRVKFTAFTYDPLTLEVGTIDGSTEGANFNLIGEELDIEPGTHEYVVDFTSYTGTDTFVGFRFTSGNSVFLDDIRWEISPLCPDVTQITITEANVNTATLSWNPGGGETAWDIVYGTEDVTDPNSLTPITPAPTGTPEGTISGLEPGTSYKVWVRSACGTPDGDGAWIGPKKFTTSCLPTDVFNENFDTTESGNLPACWSSIIRGPQVVSYDKVQVIDWNSHSGSNALRIEKDYDSTEAILVSPNLSTLPLGTHRLKLYAMGYGTSFEVGTLNSSTDQAEFSMLEEIEVTEQYTEYKIDFTVYAGTDTFIGIKLIGYSVTLDDIRWEISPLCPDVEDIEVTVITTTTATLEWASGGDETAWDIVYAEASVTNPNGLTPISPAPSGTSEGTILNLEPGTTYNAWVRSSCGEPDGDGAWIGPKTFTTPCLPTAVFFENFDTTEQGTLPDCWTSIIRGEDTPNWANIYTVSHDAYSGPNSVIISTNTENGPNSDVILVSPNLSTLPLGSYRIKFFAHSYDPAALEIGTLDSTGKNATFTLWEEVDTANQYTQHIVDFTGYEGTDTFIGIRHKSGYDIYLDDIRWELAPLCPDVTQLTALGTSTSTATINWSAGGSETSWQLVFGEQSVTNPSLLTPIDVSSNTNYTISSGLQPGTVYNAWVRSACSGTAGNGYWIGPKTFTTACIASTIESTTLESFELAVEGQLPICWSSEVLVGDENWKTVTVPVTDINTTASGSKILYKFYSTSTAILYSLPLDFSNVTSANPIQINTFLHRHENASADDKYTIYINTIPSLENAEEVFEQFSKTTAAPAVSSTGFYNYIVSIPESFYGQAQVYIIIEGFTAEDGPYALGIDDFKVEYEQDLANPVFDNSNFKFYPNPVKNTLNLSYIKNISNVSVFNLLGQKVIENTANSNTTQVDMSGLASGSYLVKVTSDNQTKTIKIIKE